MSRQNKKHRRQMKAVLKFGVSAKPKHMALSGRTGQIRVKRLKSLKHK